VPNFKQITTILLN